MAQVIPRMVTIAQVIPLKLRKTQMHQDTSADKCKRIEPPGFAGCVAPQW